MIEGSSKVRCQTRETAVLFSNGNHQKDFLNISILYNRNRNKISSIFWLNVGPTYRQSLSDGPVYLWVDQAEHHDLGCFLISPYYSVVRANNAHVRFYYFLASYLFLPFGLSPANSSQSFTGQTFLLFNQPIQSGGARAQNDNDYKTK